MRKIVIGLGVLAVVLLAALFILPSLIPSDTYRTRIQEQLSESLGREVSIEGDVSLSTFPGIRARTGAVRVASPDGFSTPDLAALEGLEARIALLPLLSRRVEIRSFTLIEPTITLERLEDGRVNWAFGDAEQAPAETPQGPFRRDGRYTDLDIDIRAFNIRNGTVRYIDRQSARDVTVDALTAFMSLPGLDKALVVDGSLRVDGVPLALDVTMDNPRAFLNGAAASIEGEFETESAELELDGAFPPGEDVAFVGAVEGSVGDAGALRAALGDLMPEIPGLAVLNSAEVSGQLDYRGPEAVSLGDARVDLQSKAGTVQFQGDARYTGRPVLDGRVQADITDAQALRSLLPEPVPGFDLLRTAALSADLSATGNKAFAISNAQLRAAGQGFTLSASGSGTYADQLSFAGPFDASTPDAGALLAVLQLDVEPSVLADAAVAGAMNAKGRMRVAGETVEVTDLVATSRSDVQSSTYRGAVRYDKAASLDGTVEATIPSLPLLDAKLATDIPNSAALGAVTLAARVRGTPETLRVSDIDAALSGGALNGRFTGTAATGDSPTVDGRFEASVPDLSALAAAIQQDVPYAEAIGRVSASGAVSGTLDALRLSGLDAALSDGLLNGRYQGTAGVEGEAVSLSGTLDVSGPSVRRLAAINGTVLPPSTEAGSVFEAFFLRGTVGGTATELQLSDAQVGVDALRGTGQFALSMAGERPRLTGQLDMGALDLRPYMNAYSAQNPIGEIQPWSTEPLPVEGLRAVDAELDLRADSVKLSRLALGPTTMDVTLQNGRLSGDMPALALYGGKGRASFALDASGAVPTVALKANLDTLDNKGFLSALAGFAKASGTAGTTVDITGRGRSQAEIMQSLQGAGDFKVLDGTIQGVDAGQFLTGLDTALRSRALPGGIGPGQVTKFRDLLGAFKLENGVASIDRFALDAVGVSAEGSGSIDLGRQTLDFRFRPKATGDTARGLAAFGVPLRFSGGFGSAKPSLDMEFLGEIAADRARLEAAKAVRERVGGTVGDVLGGVLGGGQGNTQTPATEPGTDPSEAPSVGGVIGGLLGRQPSAPATPEPTPPATPDTDAEPDAEPDSLEDAVLGIFGLKKPKPKPDPAPPQD